MNTKSFNPCISFIRSQCFQLVGLLPLVAGLSVCGCAASSKVALEDQIKGLETELLRLQRESTNLEARNNSMDDKLLLYQKKLDRCEHVDTRPMLDVVKIEPDSQPTVEEISFSDSIPTKDITIESDPDRPKLMLSGRRTVSSPSPSVAPRTTGPLSSGGFADLATDNLGVVRAEGAPTAPMERFKSAYREYSNRNYVKALKEFSDFIRDNPGHDYADNAVFWRAECYLALGKFFKAIGEFERLIVRYPSSDKAPSSLYRIGFTYDKLKDRPRALEHYFRVVDRYPGTDAARRASRRVSVIDGNNGHGSVAVPTAAKGY